MPKKSKPDKTETLSGDILDLLWTHVINPDPGGVWLDDAIKNSASAPEPLKTALPAIQRLLATTASREDFGRVARMERYERCFGLLYELEDPGLKSGKLTGLREQLLNPPGRGGKEKEFMAVVWEGIGDADDDGERWVKTSPKAAAKDEPFGDVDAAVARLRKAGAQPRDLELFTRWQRFDATVEALRLFERAGITESEELLGLHESILGAEPSGKEARPGSWPVPNGMPTSISKPNSLQPYLVLKGIESFDFTPSSNELVVRGKSGPYRIVSAQTGAERVTLAATSKLAGWEFTRDGSQVLVISGTSIVACDPETGKVLRKLTWPKKVDYLAIFPVPKGDDFLLATGTRMHADDSNSRHFRFEFCRFDGNTFQHSLLASPLHADVNPLTLHFCATATGLLAVFQVKRTSLGAWAWPELKPVWCDTNISFDSCWDLKCSTKGLFAAAAFDGTIFVGDVSTGKVHQTLELGDAIRHLAFSPEGLHLIAVDYQDRGGIIRIWNTQSWKVVCEFTTEVRHCEAMHVSPDGQTLGVKADRCCLFWKLDALLAGR